MLLEFLSMTRKGVLKKLAVICLNTKKVAMTYSLRFLCEIAQTKMRKCHLSAQIMSLHSKSQALLKQEEKETVLTSLPL